MDPSNSPSPLTGRHRWPESPIMTDLGTGSAGASLSLRLLGALHRRYELRARVPVEHRDGDHRAVVGGLDDHFARVAFRVLDVRLRLRVDLEGIGGRFAAD